MSEMSRNGNGAEGDGGGVGRLTTAIPEEPTDTDPADEELTDYGTIRGLRRLD